MSDILSSDITPVSPVNASAELDRLPATVKLAFTYASRLRRGTLDAVMPDGRHFRFGGQEPGPTARIMIRDYAFARRLLTGGDLGIAESYLRGEWETPDLTEFLLLFCVNRGVIQSVLDAKPIIRLLQRMRHWLNRNTRQQAKRNIHAHYDIGNSFYESWLDESMTYSSALFRPGEDLSSAQRSKYQSLAESVALAPGHRVLEIGCGWGGFAEFAAKTYDVQVVGLTISQEQHDYAKARIFKAGLAEKVEIKLQDYRDERGTYDRVASIEMIEAVGEEYWPTYFKSLRDRLKPGGIAGIQAITIQDGMFDAYRREIDFIRRYVFPGGMLPTPGILTSLGERFGLPLVADKVFGDDYARTLSVWRDRFRIAWPNLIPLGFDERFRRLWEYYLAYCEAGFLSRTIDVRQMSFAKVG